MVSGVVSLIVSANASLLPSEVRTILIATSRVFPDAVAQGSGVNCNTSLCGAGIVDAAFAVTAANVYGVPKPQVVSAGVYVLGLRSDGAVFEWSGASNVVQRGDISGVRRLAVSYSGSYGASHTLALRADGSVWAWNQAYQSDNTNGQLGNGTTVASTIPTPVTGLSNVADVAAGPYYSLAVKVDGTVWGWGYNGNGNLGDGTTTNRLLPVQVTGLTGVTRIAVSSTGVYGGHSLALNGDGTVWAWGNNGNGQLGDGTTTQRSAPVQVSNLTNVVAIAAGFNHSLAVKSDGTVWAWGGNSNGQLGDGTTTQRNVPAQVMGVSNVVAVAAGGNGWSLAMKSDGTVWGWGYNGGYNLGDGTNIVRLTPVQMTGMSNATGIAAGNYALVLRADGSVVVWGTGQPTPTIVPGVGGTGTLNLIQPGLRPDPFTFAPTFGSALSSTIISNPITVTGLGTGVSSPITVIGGEYSINNGAYTSTPAFVVNGDVVRIRVASSANFETLTSGTLTIGGAIGVSASFFVYTRRDPNRPASTPAVALGDNHSVLLNAKGNVFGFGYNGNGQLGNGADGRHVLPVDVVGLGNGVLSMVAASNAKADA